MVVLAMDKPFFGEISLSLKRFGGAFEG